MCTPLDAWYMSYDSRPILLQACLKSLQPLLLLCYLTNPFFGKVCALIITGEHLGNSQSLCKTGHKEKCWYTETSLQLLPIVCMKNADLSSVTWQLLVKWWWECEKCDTWRVAFRIRMKCVDCSVKARLFYFEGLVSISRQVEGKHLQFSIFHTNYRQRASKQVFGALIWNVGW